MRSLVCEKHVKDFAVRIVVGEPGVHRFCNKIGKVQFLSAVTAVQCAFLLAIVAQTHFKVVLVSDHQVFAVGIFDNALLYLLDKLGAHFGVAVTQLRVRGVVPILVRFAIHAERQKAVQLVTAVFEIACARSRVRKRNPLTKPFAGIQTHALAIVGV